jgi:DNA-binding transcriptional LysR family regulator
MELRYLRSFVAVADTLHFGQAAEELRLAQPALSQHIQKLEASLDARLLDRNRHGVALTAVGQVFLREARSILAQVQHARNEVERVKAGGQGTLRLAYVPGPARGALTCALATLRTQSPAVRVELHESNTVNLLRALLDGDYDAVLSPEFDPPFPRGLEHEEISKQQVLLVMGERHPAAKAKVVELASLKDADWVMYAETLSPGYRRWINEVCLGSGFRPRVVQRVTSSNDLQVACAMLPAVAIVPEGYRELFTDSVVFRPIDPNPDPMGLWFWWRRGDDGSAVAAFRAALEVTKGGMKKPGGVG